jgi:hypothetical protein
VERATISGFGVFWIGVVGLQEVEVVLRKKEGLLMSIMKSREK